MTSNFGDFSNCSSQNCVEKTTRLILLLIIGYETLKMLAFSSLVCSNKSNNKHSSKTHFRYNNGKDVKSLNGWTLLKHGKQYGRQEGTWSVIPKQWQAVQAAQICLKSIHKPMELWKAQVPTTSMAELYPFVIYTLVLKYSVCQWSTLPKARYSEDVKRQECWTVAAIIFNSQKSKLFQNQSACLQKNEYKYTNLQIY